MIPLSEREKQRIAGNIADVKEHIPEAAVFFKALHGAGMVDGWRSVVRAGPIDQAPQEKGVIIRGPFLTGREMAEFGKKDIKR
ncbi:MAG: hypothetical protein LLG15_07635 [Betaproteobacteria bacterium]|nr:hypothetical protein [Betaproteobacteria bacterium]